VDTLTGQRAVSITEQFLLEARHMRLARAALVPALQPLYNRDMNCQACRTEMVAQEGSLVSDHVVHVEESTYWECPRCGSFAVVARDKVHEGRVLAAGWLLQGTTWPA
jgi:hypothetical protein